MNTQKISAKRIMDHVSKIVSNGPRMDGSPSSNKSVKYVGEYLKKIGCSVDYLPLDFPYVESVKASLQVTAGDEKLEIDCLANGRSGLTDDNGIVAEAVFVDVGLENDYLDKETKGKIVFAAEEEYWQGGNLVATKFFRAVEHGAAAFVFSDHRDDGAIT